MDIHQISAFVSVATLGSFSQAAQQLHRTQPAVSRRISQLETSLDAKLFERRGREIALTPEGRVFLPHAQTIVAAARDAELAVRQSLGELDSDLPLRVALVGTLADSQVVDALRDFRARYPTMPVALRTATSREVSALVKRGEAEVGLRYFRDADPALESLPLGVERLVFVTDPLHPLAQGGPHRPTALAEENWLSFPIHHDQPDSFGHLLLRELLAAGIGEPQITYVDSLTAQKRLIEAGYGVSLLPASGCREELKAGILRQVEIKGLKTGQPVVAVTRAGGFRRPRLGEFLDLLTASMALDDG